MKRFGSYVSSKGKELPGGSNGFDRSCNNATVVPSLTWNVESHSTHAVDSRRSHAAFRCIIVISHSINFSPHDKLQFPHDPQDFSAGESIK